jgi:hypothetical protein
VSVGCDWTKAVLTTTDVMSSVSSAVVVAPEVVAAWRAGATPDTDVPPRLHSEDIVVHDAAVMDSYIGACLCGVPGTGMYPTAITGTVGIALLCVCV